MTKLVLFWAGICVAAVALTGCGGSNTGARQQETSTATATAGAPATATPASHGAPTLTIKNMSFGDPITVPPGAQITVVNDDPVEHSVTSRTAGQFNVEVDGNEQKTLTAPNQPGQYPFYCVYHSNMAGTLIVQ
jgi:plastocyanin